MVLAKIGIAGATALGVALVAVPLAAGQRSGSAPLTFSKDVAPILFANCASCHRPGQIGPFSLLSYRDVRQRATQVADVTARRLMPPWKPEPGLIDFVGERALTDEQIRVIQDWVAQGAPEGDKADLPQPPEWTDGWQLGTPDLIVSAPEPYVLQVDGPDVFRTFVIPIPTETARYVKAVEFRPDNPRAMHHANFGVDRTGSSRRLDQLDPEPGYNGAMLANAAYPFGQMLSWSPGHRPRGSPEGAAWRLERGSDLVVAVHLQPTGKPEPVQVRVGFYFTDDAPVRAPVALRLGSETIDIAPGDRQYEVKDSYTLPVDVEVLAIQPHAHNLARRMEAAATLPDGSTRPLLSIADWDFRWQDVYRYARPFVLPKGTTISMRFTYDNSEENVRNPHHPPRRVVWGENTAAEMGNLWIQVVPRTNADLGTLDEDVSRKRRGVALAGNTKLLQSDPANPVRHNVAAMLYFQDGQTDRAIEHLRESLRLNPASAPTRYNLGLALSAEGRFDEAARAFMEAVDLDPEHLDAHYNLGAMLHVMGRLDEAAVHYRRAIELNPYIAETHNNFGWLLSAQGRGPEAIAHLREALQLRPEWESAAAGLAWALATSSEAAADPGEAVRLGERAAAATGHADPSILDVLAAAYAAAGQFERAIETARAAVELAVRAQALALADQIRVRLGLYERGVPYHPQR